MRDVEADNDSYTANWNTDLGFDEFEDVIRGNYESPGEVETLGVFRRGEEDLGERLESTFDRVINHEYPGGKLHYMEFRHGYHTISLGREDDLNEFTLNVRFSCLAPQVQGDQGRTPDEGGMDLSHSDLEPLNRYLDRTTDKSEPEIDEALDEAREEIISVNADN